MVHAPAAADTARRGRGRLRPARTAAASERAALAASPAAAPAGNAPAPIRPAVGGWSRYPAGDAFLSALARGAAPRAVWTALPGGDWAEEIARAAGTAAATGRGALIVVPD